MPTLYSHFLGVNKPANMSSFTSSSFVGDFYSRRLLLTIIPLCQPPATATPPASGLSHDVSGLYTGDHSSNEAVIVISVLICALICSMGLCSVVRCGSIRCRSLVPSVPLANTGIKKKLLKTFPTLTYSDGLDQPGLDTQCVICLSEFIAGECVRVLPKCKHGFHVQCIDKWLDSQSSCPTCRHCLNCTPQASSSQPPPPQPLQELAIVSITPLQAEGMIHNYWNNDQHVINIGIEKIKLATKCGLTS